MIVHSWTLEVEKQAVAKIIPGNLLGGDSQLLKGKREESRVKDAEAQAPKCRIG